MKNLLVRVELSLPEVSLYISVERAPRTHQAVDRSAPQRFRRWTRWPNGQVWSGVRCALCGGVEASLDSTAESFCMILMNRRGLLAD